MQRFCSRFGLAAILLAITLFSFPHIVRATDRDVRENSHFPKPLLLEPNVEFWKQIYTEYGVGDFVLHDRDRLGLVYAVVRVGETSNQARAADRARPEIQRLRTGYQEILTKLADSVPPEELGPEGRAVWQAWGCPCSPEDLRRAADNIRVQQGLRQKVDEGMQRAQKLLPRIVAILREHSVPVELAALPLVESSYNPQAYSKAGAAGLWQFIRSTGKQYLTITRKRDDRRDPLRATEAAAHLLRHNYEALGSWPLAIIAYNHGREGIRAARAAVGSSAIEDIIASYTGPRFGFASKNFYAEFLAALDVVQPYIGGHGKLLTAKGRQRGVQQASLPVQRLPIEAPVTPASPTTPPPVHVEQPAETAAPAVDASPVESPIAPEERSGTADLPGPTPVSATEEAERPIDPSAPPAVLLPAEQTVVSEAISSPAETVAPITDVSSDSVTAPTPTADAPQHDRPPVETRETESIETVSP